MDPDPRPIETAPPSAGPHVTRRIVLYVLAFLLVPVVLAVGLFPYLLDEPFSSVDDLDPAKIRSLRVYLLNRGELDGGEDIGPYYAAESDFPSLLKPLREVPEVQEFPNARGPWLGEYRILTQDGRRGRIRFYYVRPGGNREAPARLRFQIGDKKFEGGRADTIVQAAEAAREHRIR